MPTTTESLPRAPITLLPATSAQCWSNNKSTADLLWPIIIIIIIAIIVVIVIGYCAVDVAVAVAVAVAAVVVLG